MSVSLNLGEDSTLNKAKVKIWVWVLGLPSLEERRRGDMIQTWKILHQHDDVCEKIWFTRLNTASTVSTRLNSSIFNLEMKRTNLKKLFFC